MKVYLLKAVLTAEAAIETVFASLAIPALVVWASVSALSLSFGAPPAEAMTDGARVVARGAQWFLMAAICAWVGARRTESADQSMSRLLAIGAGFGAVIGAGAAQAVSDASLWDVGLCIVAGAPMGVAAALAGRRYQERSGRRLQELAARLSHQ